MYFISNNNDRRLHATTQTYRLTTNTAGQAVHVDLRCCKMIRLSLAACWQAREAGLPLPTRQTRKICMRGASDINNSTSIPNYCAEAFGDLVLYVNKALSAWTEVWSCSYRSRARFCFRGSFWADFEIFEIQGGAGDIYNSISMPNYYHTCLP